MRRDGRHSPRAMGQPELEDIAAAHRRIAEHVHRTPVLTSASLDAELGARLHFKCENFQKVGAFKARGAMNAVLALAPDAAAAGVVTHSSGNHGAALAFAARKRGIPAWIVVPEGALASKLAAIERYGGTIVACPPTLADRERTADRIRRETGARLIHPYNDPWVIAGQGTAALELLEQVPDLDTVIAPVGGGGLLSGAAIVFKTLRPASRVLGAEPAGADDASRSLASGRIVPMTDPKTIADGLRSSLGELTFGVLSQRADGILTASEEGIVAAMRSVWEILKIVIEPSSAVVLAAIREHPDRIRGRRVGLILTGGNIDLDRLPF